MAQILDDNTVVPSWQGLTPRGGAMDTGNFSNMALRMGEVKDIVFPDDTKSISKKFVEYTVEVQHRDGRNPGTTSKYLGCLVMNGFGGAADVFHYTLRKDDQSKSTDDGVGVGSKVLMLCVNGQTTRAMIIGGLRDLSTDTEAADKKDDGHNLLFSFNGITAVINKDGEFGLQFVGPTKVDGTLDTDAGADDKNGPTQVEVLKNGNLKISTKDDNQVILINHADKKIEFTVDEEWKVTVNKKVTEDYGDSWTLTAGSSISITGKKDVSFEAKDGDWNMTASGNAVIKSSGVLTGGASDFTMMGTTYRQAQETLHETLEEQLESLVEQLGIIAIAVNGPLKIPIYGGAAASVAMGPAVIQCATAAGQMLAAIEEFEATADTYLSSKNKSD